jgi:hypothetical protein
MEQVAHAVSLNFGRVFGRQMLWLESLEALLANFSETPNENQSPTIGVPLQVPNDVRRLRREQVRREQEGGRPGEDEISFG